MRSALLAFVALLAASVLTDGAGAATLKARATIDRDDIQLGDLWSGLPPDQAEKSVIQAPPTGQRVTIDASQLAALADANGIDWQSTGRNDRAIVERVSLMIEVPVPVRPIEAGEIIRATDLGFERMRADRLNKQVVTETSHLVGKTTKHALSATQPIRVTDIGTTLLVTKNGIVSVRIVSGRLNLMMQGKSMDDGGEGDTVRVVNPRSGKVLQGVVHGAGTVYVDPGYPIAVN
jgi:flagella basal body P-ring formation protein FlgA